MAETAPARIRIPFVQFEKHLFLEIRDRKNRELVTVVELLSPTNKKTGPDREQYLAKRGKLLRGNVHLIEIDLLRGWPRMPMEPEMACDYCIMVSRVEDRPEASFWPLKLRDRLPPVPVPLANRPRMPASICSRSCMASTTAPVMRIISMRSRCRVCAARTQAGPSPCCTCDIIIVNRMWRHVFNVPPPAR